MHHKYQRRSYRFTLRELDHISEKRNWFTSVPFWSFCPFLKIAFGCWLNKLWNWHASRENPPPEFAIVNIKLKWWIQNTTHFMPCLDFSLVRGILVESVRVNFKHRICHSCLCRAEHSQATDVTNPTNRSVSFFCHYCKWNNMGVLEHCFQLFWIGC